MPASDVGIYDILDYIRVYGMHGKMLLYVLV